MPHLLSFYSIIIFGCRISGEKMARYKQNITDTYDYYTTPIMKKQLLAGIHPNIFIPTIHFISGPHHFVIRVSYSSGVISSPADMTS